MIIRAARLPGPLLNTHTFHTFHPTSQAAAQSTGQSASPFEEKS